MIQLIIVILVTTHIVMINMFIIPARPSSEPAGEGGPHATAFKRAYEPEKDPLLHHERGSDPETVSFRTLKDICEAYCPQ